MTATTRNSGAAETVPESLKRLTALYATWGADGVFIFYLKKTVSSRTGATGSILIGLPQE
jgi:hypothetical protein